MGILTWLAIPLKSLWLLTVPATASVRMLYRVISIGVFPCKSVFSSRSRPKQQPPPSVTGRVLAVKLRKSQLSSFTAAPPPCDSAIIPPGASARTATEAWNSDGRPFFYTLKINRVNVMAAQRSWECILSRLRNSTNGEIDDAFISQLVAHTETLKDHLYVYGDIYAMMSAVKTANRLYLAQQESALETLLEAEAHAVQSAAEQELEMAALVNAYRAFRQKHAAFNSLSQPSSPSPSQNLGTPNSPTPAPAFAGLGHTLTIASPSGGIGDDDLLLTSVVNGRTMTVTEAITEFKTVNAEAAARHRVSTCARYGTAQLRMIVREADIDLTIVLALLDLCKGLEKPALSCLEEARLRRPHLFSSDDLDLDPGARSFSDITAAMATYLGTVQARKVPFP
ncbi:hypothetical protein CC85DRAFT_305870 [Cutaneotrichosporon oleaginosum]|uniref:Uncharacterized protein n=1 Tax=Cutaneotrichosporon oleaginosum TaxID=879819 RepID=A0A0J0XBV2_9TREE|nr:uncharacterized protein CC85DRAFT_305870 [Cutaneotrichosporon oleaginosum]KLT38537.1 hypothetical protein CC85DRAFT_305870 [Cutaneotrichosporon oleaginosum]TXT08584.1 hypothetical protein COLE_05508 [Cutaneotrichosporon oleaginosum]